MKKILWVKFGWSDYYRGGQVDGNFSWLDKNSDHKAQRRGHEAYNFKPDSKGIYYCYVPPQTGTHPPKNVDNHGWTVICLAKHPKRSGIHIVGWYEDATLIGKWEAPPPSHSASPGNIGSPYDWSYCIKSKSAYLVPPELRTEPFSDTSVRQGKFSFLSGPNVKTSDNKQRVLKLLGEKIKKLETIVVKNPNDEKLPDHEMDSVDPLLGFGNAEHRKKVELAAESAAVKYFEEKGYNSNRVADLNLGYDYIFKNDSEVLHVEVKGTSAKSERFFMSRNENQYREHPRWRLAMVIDALAKRSIIKIYTNTEVNKKFDIEPLTYIAKRLN